VEGLEGRPRVNGCRGVYEVFDLVDDVGLEDGGVIEVGDEEGVGRGSGQLVWWHAGEIYRHWGS